MFLVVLSLLWQIPEGNTVKEGWYIFFHGVRFYALFGGTIVSGHVVGKHSMATGEWWTESFIYWQLEEREDKGPGSR